ncbi:MAG TPA: tRNA 5-methoxyuridine(34)/uridine 5-oxyacetic acid(34) synthase CmoB [Gammaproteobacteria bacterium]
MRFYAGLEKIQGNPEFLHWRDTLSASIGQVLRPAAHGRMPEWVNLLQQLPCVPTEEIHYDKAAISVRPVLPVVERDRLQQLLLRFKPWRKGPFDIHGVYIDSEWRSDLKWERLRNHIAPLHGRLVLDVGCGNGYHLWRMQGAGARAALGLDPVLPYLMQYFAVQHFIHSVTVFVLPFALEALPAGLQAFDTVFSMGVLYHCRAPLEHLQQLRQCLGRGGELVLETLVVEGAADYVLAPADRYARMKNVRFIPSCPALEAWLQQSGFTNIRLLNVAPTTAVEQRVTPWSGEVSLADFLDPADSTKTIEGYPAPRRAIMLANAS